MTKKYTQKDINQILKELISWKRSFQVTAVCSLVIFTAFIVAMTTVITLLGVD